VQRGFENIRTGSHNVVVGQQHNFTRVGGIVAGQFNTISGDFAAVSGGQGNTASSDCASVSGGSGMFLAGSHVLSGNLASGFASPVSGGRQDIASGDRSSIGGGEEITADSGWRAGSISDEIVGSFRFP
jgi:hypothetical protein